MDNNELIGRVAAEYFATRLQGADLSSTARYLLDQLSAEQTVAIAKAILGSTTLQSLIDIKLPEKWLRDCGLPPHCLTTERATYYRNAPCEKAALLIATPGDDERQSLADLTIIDSNQLRSHVDLWVDVAARGLPLNEQHRRWWNAALTALQEIAAVSLDRFAAYVLRTREEIEQGTILLEALGEALPTLRWPRNPAMFRSLNEKTARHVSKWKALFQHVQRRQACYLKKSTPNNQLLSADELTASFQHVRDVIPEEYHATIGAFISAPSNWNDEAEALAHIEWETVKPLFDGLARERFNLGRATQKFYDDREEDLLSRDEVEYLRALAENRHRATEPIDDDINFYRTHRGELKDDASLKSKWDRFIFGSPIETGDFLYGLAMCLESLFDQDLPEGAKRELRIIADKRTKSDLKKLNVEAGQYFSLRYRGLRELFGRSLFDVGSLFEYDAIQDAWTRERRYKPNQSTARAALQIKFYVELTVNDGAIENHRQLVWHYEPNAICSELYSDMVNRLAEHPFMLGHVSRETIGPKGISQPLDLRDVRSLSAAFGQDRGSLIPVYRKEQDLTVIWKRNLEEARTRNSISAATAERVDTLFKDFANAYRAALQMFVKASVAGPEIRTQYVAYGQLLEAVIFEAKGDRNRELLVKPLLGLGVVPVYGAAPAAIVAPWNPMRLQAMASKASRMASLVRHLIKAPNVLFGDATLYFKELRDELDHPYFPEVVLGWRERKPELISLTDTFMDYSLHECPLISESLDADTNEHPADTAGQIVDLIQRYLTLFPHEQASFSAVLYNCDAASLPQAVVNKINELHEDETDMRCEVVLRHRDRAKLHRLYESILESGDADTDGFVSSEASRDFMARLRIGIMADEAPVPDPKDGPRADLVFLHDVISRHASIEWYREDATPVAIDEIVPSRWSRRRPSAQDEQKSIVYLCSPAQTEEGWAYMTAIASHFRPDWDTDKQRRYIPARQLDFHDPDTGEIFRETHNLANWVVNFDELLDRRQLVNQGVKVIRYKQAVTQGRNLLVSSTAPLGLLHTMLNNRIKDLIPEKPDEEVRALAQRFIDDANLISGDIVLRAAKRGRNASELMGVVLSHYLAKWELGLEKKVGFYFLDDYSEWLGQREEQIADLLILSPEILPNGERQLSVLVTEAKYIQDPNLAEKRKESQKQLRDTVRRIEQALFGHPDRLDRELWLARFSDLLLSGIPYAAAEELDLIGFRRALREGKCPIYLRGYSHVFVCGPSDGADCTDFVEVAELSGSYQEIYSRAKTRALVDAYAANVAPESVRASVADVSVLREREFRPIGPNTRIEPVRLASSTSEAAPQTSSKTRQAATSVPASSRSAADEVASSAPSGEANAFAQPTSKAWPYGGIGAILQRRISAPEATTSEDEWLRTTVGRMRAALQQFQLNSKIVQEPKLTPNAAIIRFQGAANMTVELALKRRSEFLTTHGLNLISARGEPGAVAMYVARPSRQVLHTLDVWKQWTPGAAGGNHQLFVAVKEEDNQPLFVSPTDHAPHTLIAGATGSGKSVLMQNIILSIACTNTPEQAQILLIDPKLGVDYFAFDGLPHLRSGIIENQPEAVDRLTELVSEMDRRYTVLKENRCANIFELNRKSRPTESLPYLWVIHDEFAEWMMTEDYRNAVSNIVSRLGVKARAAGIFLVFAAQRPDSNVMPMQLRSNLGNRLILRVDSEGTSEIALGEKGAERLLGRGHMAAKLEGHTGIIYGQVPLISADEITEVVNAIRGH
ncbi:MAG: FtsK/SpoIIIE domain-containing protein [Burkholderiales bacterium]